jgi:hypothetical protein
MSWLWSWFTGKVETREEGLNDVREVGLNDVKVEAREDGLNTEPEILEHEEAVPMPSSVVVYAQKICSKCNLNLRRVHFYKKEWRKTPRVCKSCKG